MKPLGVVGVGVGGWVSGSVGGWVGVRVKDGTSSS